MRLLLSLLALLPALALAQPFFSPANVFGGATATTDNAAQGFIHKSNNAWPRATVNTSGANTVVAGGIGRRLYTVVTFGNLAGKTATLTVNGTATVLTEGVQWTAATSNAATATSLATAINKVSGVTAAASSAIVYITPNPGTYSLTIATNGGADMTATSGTDGSVSIVTGSGSTLLTSPICFANDTDTCVISSAANAIGFQTGGTERWVINSSGAFNPILDNTYDIGNSTVNPRDIQVSRSLIAGKAGVNTGTVKILGTTSGTATITTAAAAGTPTLTLPTATGTLALTAGTGLPAEFCVAAGDETTAITAGTAKVTWRMPYAMTVTAVRGSLTTAQPSGAQIFTVDVNEGGVSILSTKLTIDNTETTSTTAATPPVISNSSLADDAQMSIDVDAIGDSGAKGLKVCIVGTRT